MADDLTDLNHCPLCGGAEGYFLGDGETYHWWDVACKACGESVTECRADSHMTINREPPPARHPNADAAWQEATKHYAEVCGNVDRLIARVAALEAENAALREMARAHVDILRGIYALLYPKPTPGPDGTVYVFRPKDPDPHTILQVLSDRIRAIPDQIAAIDAAKTPEARDAV